ncbi:ABC transporter substrate-binding protein [Natrinema amylolyticum]|uniref:ABC transporter substrate-binding protein n=1 Tax=Natrinema amylolyticum TaxID=2878679 RepID=UPI001CFB1D67|nr:ABC transporter substrate-binding protein [Natrinema amylolyticum]
MLAATAGLTVSSSGCLRQVRNIVRSDDIQQLSVTITTVPADADRQSVRIARHLEENLTAVGVDVSIDLRSDIEFRRAVLYDHDFEICIGRHPGGADPDFLYEALYSRYIDESGWQNPFGFSNQNIDALLEDQRNAEGDDRRKAVTAMLEAIATEQPFVPICVPEEHRVARTDRFDGWSEGHLATRHGYLGLDPADGVDALRVAHTDARPTENLNPIATDYRHRGTITDLLYDSLATQNGDEAIEPWLAESWEWDGRTVDISLRDGCEFHDGEPLSAEDVKFTYQFLQDTSLGDHDTASPAPLYRGQVDAVKSVDIRHGHRVELTVETSPAVGERALLVPILPAHIWRDRATDVMGPGGPSIAQGTTEAVVTNNVPPIGSGPFQFAGRTEGTQLTLERFDDHFTRRPTVDLPAPTVDECPIEIHPSGDTAAQVVANDDADVTSLPLGPSDIGGVDTSNDVQLLESSSWSFYCLGFNTRDAPFSNYRFRRVLAQLLDKEWLVDEIFHGHARPVATAVTDEWVPESLEWDGRDPETPFLGSEGEVDVRAAKGAFEAAGFRYDDHGRLRVRQ